MSVQSSIMDKISSIFTLGRQSTQPPKEARTNISNNQSIKQDEGEENKSR